MKLFYTGPNVTAELLVVMLENHGITSRSEFEEGAGPQNELERTVRVFVEDHDYDRAHKLLYAEREDEL